MALRSRSRTGTATSGPGRGPTSDGRTRTSPRGTTRTRHRRPPTRGRAARPRHASADELRRRAEALFSERAGEWRESGKGPPGGEERVPDVSDGADGADGTDAPDGTGISGGGLRSSSAVVGAVASGDRMAWGGVALPDRLPPGGFFAEDDTDVGFSDRSGSATGGRRARLGLALRERMPVWLQTRCGLEWRGVLALTVLLVVAGAFAVQHFWAGRTEPVGAPEVVRAVQPYGAGEPGEESVPAAPAGAPSAAGTAAAEIVVDVGGKVREPGIHSLPTGSRVADALRAAGGVRPGTNTDGLNRARFLVDGEQVIVGGTAAPAVPGSGGAPAVGGAGGTMAGTAGAAAPVLLNTATVEQLDTLPGVGPVLAQHIIDYRTQHGGFRSVDELREVNGIGDRRFADLRNLVRP
ncbi:helix-hairpin-helix domain-containing protein [Streptomyces sp. NPDC005263]|uniref:helix-hairpin-helix domain-containing protein n=1 Tax=Streptomyces sp. NPDC005263 TaxID=3364711 RepID=UPI003697E837